MADDISYATGASCGNPVEHTPRAMSLHKPVQAVSRGSEQRIASLLAQGCWQCNSGAADLVRRTIANGSQTVVLQCMGCGRQLGNAMPLTDHPGRDSYLEWDACLPVAFDAQAQASREAWSREQFNATRALLGLPPVTAWEPLPPTPAPLRELPAPAAPEADVSAHLVGHLKRLEADGRCVWRPEVRLKVWTHACKGAADTLRIDFLLILDGGPLIGIEVKRRPNAPAELGRDLLQCLQYSMGQVMAGQAQPIPPEWVAQPLKATFLRFDRRGLCDSVAAHAQSAPRLFGPANVGLARFEDGGKLKLEIGGERWWCERRGYRADAHTRTHRGGNGNFRPEGVQ